MYSFLATGQAGSYSGYSDPRVDRLLTRAARQVGTDAARRDVRRGVRSRAAGRPAHLPLPPAQPHLLSARTSSRLDVRRRRGPLSRAALSATAGTHDPLPAQPPGQSVVTPASSPPSSSSSASAPCRATRRWRWPARRPTRPPWRVRADLGLDQAADVAVPLLRPQPPPRRPSAPPSHPHPGSDLIATTLLVTCGSRVRR